MSTIIKVRVIESNFHEEVLNGREIELNLDHVRLILHNEKNSILFFQNEDCLKVEPRVEWLEPLKPERGRPVPNRLNDHTFTGEPHP